MKKLREYLKLMRMKHYLKNILIFVPLLFSGQFTNTNKVIITIIGFVSFSLIASVVYIVNDWKDIEIDKQHPKKKNRPLASGNVSKFEAIVLGIILLIIIVILNAIIWLNGDISIKHFMISISIEILYLLLNIGYSFGLKNIPIVDVLILVSGFVFRILYGAKIGNIAISNWLYLTVMSGSLYLAFGKRRNEIIKQGEKSREVVKKYNKDFLDKFMYVCLILAIVFYSLWCIDATTIERVGNSYMIWTIPLLLIIMMKYSLNIENNDSFGDPVDVILEDKILLLLVLLFCIMMVGILYIL